LIGPRLRRLTLPIQEQTDSNTLYISKAHEAECVGKGKAEKRGGFGVKVGAVASLRKSFMLACPSFTPPAQILAIGARSFRANHVKDCVVVCGRLH
jgi:hypothetical protein